VIPFALAVQEAKGRSDPAFFALQVVT